jgi:hypothetical protein
MKFCLQLLKNYQIIITNLIYDTEEAAQIGWPGEVSFQGNHKKRSMVSEKEKLV